MRAMSNYISAIFMSIYWIFRIVVSYMNATGKDFLVTPLNPTIEIVLLFVTLICIILVIANKRIGGLIYGISYIAYFGADVINTIVPQIKNYSFDFNMSMNTMFSAVAVILAIIVLINMLAEDIKPKQQKNTDWFYENKDYERKLDERADKNNYKLN